LEAVVVKVFCLNQVGLSLHLRAGQKFNGVNGRCCWRVQSVLNPGFLIHLFELQMKQGECHAVGAEQADAGENPIV